MDVVLHLQYWSQFRSSVERRNHQKLFTCTAHKAMLSIVLKEDLVSLGFSFLFLTLVPVY